MIDKKVISKILFGVLAAAAWFVWRNHIQRSLSLEVRAAVLAAVGENTSLEQAQFDLQAAKLACRTKRDFEVVGNLDKAVAKAVSAAKWKQLSEPTAFSISCAKHEIPNEQLCEYDQQANKQDFDNAKKDSDEAGKLLTQVKLAIAQ